MGIGGQTLIILDARGITYQLKEDVIRAYREYNISEDFDYFYDWMIMEGFRQAICMQIEEYRFTLLHLEKSQLYRAIFEDIGPLIVTVLREFIRTNHLSFFAHNKVKMMVTYNDIVIARYA